MMTRAPSSREAIAEPAHLRGLARAGRFRSTTSGHAPGYLQGNLAILPASHAADFLRFCTLNPKPCPLLGVGEPGETKLPSLGEDVDLGTDLPGYRVFRDGERAESLIDLREIWRDDLVGFVLGCSFSFEDALMRAGIPLPHAQERRNVAMYRSTIETTAAGPFGGPMVVSMRAFSPKDAIAAILLSSRYPKAHGAPVHIGRPSDIGIADLERPDFGDAPVMREGDLPVFWACGVTPQSAIRRARPEIAIVHEPGHMLVTDLPAEAVE